MGSILFRAVLRVGVIAVVLVAMAARVEAQPQPPPSEADKAAAKQLVSEGIAAQDRKDYDKALDLYWKAYDLIPHPSLIYNIAIAHRLAEHLEEAAKYYEQYLAEDPNGAQVPEARRQLGQIRAKLAAAQAATAAAAPAPAEPPPAPSPPPRTDTPARAGRSLRITGIAAGGVGIACAGAAIAFGLRLESIEKEQLDRFNAGLPYEPDRVKAGEAAERNQYIAAALAGTLVVGGAALYWVGHRQGRAAPTTAWLPLIGPDVAGIAVTGALP